MVLYPTDATRATCNSYGVLDDLPVKQGQAVVREEDC
jgi:hypothetical protein